MEDLKSEERTWGTITHIAGFAGGIIPFGNIFVPLIVWQLKKNESKFVNENGKSSLNFQISFTIYMMILALIAMIFFFTNVTAYTYDGAAPETFPIFMILIFGVIGVSAIAQFILLIIASMKASQGEVFHYPLAIKFIK